MQNSQWTFVTSLSILLSGLMASRAQAQCSRGGGAMTPSTSAPVASSASSLASMNSTYPSTSGYSAMSPMAFQQSIYQQIAYQQQLNLQRQMIFAGKQQAKKATRTSVQAANETPSSSNPLNRSHEAPSLASAVSDPAGAEAPAERLFAIATRADHAGRDTAAERLYKRVIVLAPGSRVASQASERLSGLVK